MLKLNKKIKAFTISEMLVVLVISGIAISLTMLILSLVQQQIGAMNSNYGQHREVLLLEKALWKDVNKYDLYYDHVKRQLHFISEVDTVSYTFNQEYVIRNMDTLAIPVPNMDIYLNGEITKGKDIDALELTISKEITDKKLFIYKINDASFYINNDGI